MAFQQGIPCAQERNRLQLCSSDHAKTAGQHRCIGEQGMSDHGMMSQDILDLRRVNLAIHITDKGKNLLDTEGGQPL